MRRPLRSDEARSVVNLAIDLGDPGRMAKARRIHRGNHVGSVDISPGLAEMTVADQSGEIHDVSVNVISPVRPGQDLTAQDVTSTCSCEDGSDVCTHALAGILGIAEEIEANGRLLAVWAGEVPTEEQSTETVVVDGPTDDFLAGRWTGPPPIKQMAPLKFDDEPELAVDGVDAGPVLVDARAAIRRGLSRYRVQG